MPGLMSLLIKQVVVLNSSPASNCNIKPPVNSRNTSHQGSNLMLPQSRTQPLQLLNPEWVPFRLKHSRNKNRQPQLLTASRGIHLIPMFQAMSHRRSNRTTARLRNRRNLPVQDPAEANHARKLPLEVTLC